MKTLFLRQALASFLFTTLFIGSIFSQKIESEIDQLVSNEYPANEPGVSILVAKDGKPIYRKAFGMADLELSVPSAPENVYEIGSITKQFTAVAILMLEEQGKLSISDDITKYIPDYPTQGNTITIHHLLNHTSGIKSYTAIESFVTKARTDMTPVELIDVFKNEPMDFKTGEKFLYNNSGYILLGYIIEQVTGDTYENFVEKNIFEKLGMTSSYYGSNNQIIKNRASGYKKGNDGYANSDYISMTLPYAAGSLMSTVDDLLKWQNVVRDNKLISKESLEKAVNGSKLNNGEEISYGYGWGKVEIQGASGYSHGGGIFGYTTSGLYLKNEDVYVIALTNCNCKNINALTPKIAAVAIGKAYPKVEDAITLKEDELKQWVGAYEFEEGVIRHITYKDGALYSLREGENPQSFKLYPLSKNRFLFDDVTIEYQFRKNAEGDNEAVFVSSGEKSMGKSIDKAPPAERVVIELSTEVLKQYVGKYEIQPNFILEIVVKDSQIFAQATGQPEFEIFADKEDHFFVKVVPAELSFKRNDAGSIESLILHQGGQNIPAKKIE